MSATLAQVNPALREVRLYGALGRQFGRVFRLAVMTPAEAVQALAAVLPGFRNAFLGPDGRAKYHVFVGRGQGRHSIGEAQAGDLVGRMEPIRLVPEVQGAKRAGAVQTVIGAVLFVVGLVMNYYAPGSGSGLMQTGALMMLGGVIQLLSPQRKREEESSKPLSYAFDGPINNTEQGGPVPLVFGRVICGSTVVSQGLSSVEIVIPPPAPLDPVPVPDYYEDYPSTGGDGTGGVGGGDSDAGDGIGGGDF